MTREIVIELPDTVEINGAKDAPENLRVIKTEKWDAEFLLTAMVHGISQKIGDTWSVTKKDVSKTAKTHESLEAGDWAQRRATGASAAKFDAAIAALNVQALMEKLTPEQLSALAAMAVADK